MKLNQQKQNLQLVKQNKAHLRSYNNNSNHLHSKQFINLILRNIIRLSKMKRHLSKRDPYREKTVFQRKSQ